MADYPTKAKLKHRLVPWFDLSHYQRCKFFGAIDWFQQVACRIDLQRISVLWGRPTSGLSPEIVSKEVAFSELVKEILSAGIVPRSLLSELLEGGRDLSPERFATLSLLDVQGCNWSARLDLYQWRRDTLDKESVWDGEGSTSLSRW